MSAFFLLVSLLTFPQVSQAACHGSKTSYRAEFTGKLTIDNQVLANHVIATFSVKSFTECSRHCDEDCRCRSFNLPMSGEGECELNSADNSTVLVKPRRGWRYHHLQVKEVVAGSTGGCCPPPKWSTDRHLSFECSKTYFYCDSCYEPYSNGCCDRNPCANNALCTELGDFGKPGFNCTCANEYNTGPFCEREINSCFDYLWNDKTVKSGYYDIWEKDTLIKSTVYCDMRPEEWEAWTLVMSYAKENVSDFESAPFYVDAPRDEANADSGNYRLSLAKMKSIEEGMRDGREVAWKATCGYSFATGQPTTDDVVQSSFNTLNLFSFTTHEKGLVGYYPFDNVTEGNDMSGYDNHASMHDTSYEEGPLGNPQGSTRMSGSQYSYIELNDHSGMLDTRYSLTIMMQLYIHVTSRASLVGWKTAGIAWGPHVWSYDRAIYFRVENRDGRKIRSLEAANQLHPNQWIHVAVVYDYDNARLRIFRDGKRKNSAGVGPFQEIGTQSSHKLTVGAMEGSESYPYNGRVACLRIYNTAFTDEEVAAFSESWDCPHEPAPICHRVDYIKVRGHECYNCRVWATQKNTETFSINAYRGDEKCNFNSGSTIPDENIFGVYKVVDSANHACASSDAATTQYWFGGKL